MDRQPQCGIIGLVLLAFKEQFGHGGSHDYLTKSKEKLVCAVHSEPIFRGHIITKSRRKLNQVSFDLEFWIMGRRVSKIIGIQENLEIQTALKHFLQQTDII